MPTLEIEFDVICSCGEDLTSTEERRGSSQYITVEPCEKCLDQSYSDGIKTGEQT